MTMPKRLDSIFRNKEGKIAVFQWPNLPLTVWILATLASKVLAGNLQKASSGVAFVALLMWAVLEISSGESIFRRIVGALVLAWLLFRIFWF